MAEQTLPPNGVRDAAVFLLSLGEEAAAEVLKHLGAKDVQRIGAAMSEVGQLSRVQVTQTLDRFLQEVETQVSVGVGADEFIRTMLTKALGEDKASGLIDRILFGRSSKGLEMLKWMDARGVADNIRNEHPQTIAVVLAYLDADQAAEVLGRLPENVRPEVVARIATLDGVQPSALSQLDDVIERQFSGKVATRTASLGGAKAAANIRAAVDARTNPDTVIVARTDARAQFGIKEAIGRACRYAEVGADVIFVEAPQSVEEIEQIAAQVEAPLLLNLVPGGLTPKVEHKLLAELGYRIAIHPGAALATVVPAVAEALRGLMGQTPRLETTADPAGFFDLLGLGSWNKLGERYREIDHVGLPR